MERVVVKQVILLTLFLIDDLFQRENIRVTQHKREHRGQAFIPVRLLQRHNVKRQRTGEYR